MLKQLRGLSKTFSTLSRREKLVLYAAVGAVSFTLLDRLIVYPIYTRMRQVQTQIRDRENEIVRNMRILSKKERINADVERYVAYLRAAEDRSVDMTAVLKSIEELAQKSELSVVDMKPAGIKENEKEKTKKYVVNLNGEGEMSQIVDFMYRVENSSDLLTIERVQISPKSRESSVAQCAFMISRMFMDAANP